MKECKNCKNYKDKYCPIKGYFVSIQAEWCDDYSELISEIEHKAINLFNDKFGTDVKSRFEKVKEEFNELIEAFNSCNLEHIKDEICDCQATLSHFASLHNLYNKNMLETAIDKVIKRETNPNYKRL